MPSVKISSTTPCLVRKLFNIDYIEQLRLKPGSQTVGSEMRFLLATETDCHSSLHWGEVSAGDSSSVGTYLSGTARAVPLLKVGRLVMHFAVPLFGHRLHIALQVYMSNDHAACKFPHLLYQEAFSLHCLIYSKIG